MSQVILAPLLVKSQAVLGLHFSAFLPVDDQYIVDDQCINDQSQLGDFAGDTQANPKR